MSLLKHGLRLLILVVSLCGALASHAQDIAGDQARISALLDELEVIFAKGDIDGAMKAFTVASYSAGSSVKRALSTSPSISAFL